MSTKAIRRAIELSLGGRVSEEAMAEVEAIERAAKDFVDGTRGMALTSVETMESIAKDAP